MLLQVRLHPSWFPSHVLLTVFINYTDHDERIPLFTRAVETDPELPYGPLLQYVDQYPPYKPSC